MSETPTPEARRYRQQVGRYVMSITLHLDETLPENDEERLPRRITDALNEAGITNDASTLRIREEVQRG